MLWEGFAVNKMTALKQPVQRFSKRLFVYKKQAPDLGWLLRLLKPSSDAQGTTVTNSRVTVQLTAVTVVH